MERQPGSANYLKHVVIIKFCTIWVISKMLTDGRITYVTKCLLFSKPFSSSVPSKNCSNKSSHIGRMIRVSSCSGNPKNVIKDYDKKKLLSFQGSKLSPIYDPYVWGRHDPFLPAFICIRCHNLGHFTQKTVTMDNCIEIKAKAQM